MSSGVEAVTTGLGVGDGLTLFGDTIGDGEGVVGFAEIVAVLTPSGTGIASVCARSFIICCQLFMVAASDAVTSRGAWSPTSESKRIFALVLPFESFMLAISCLESGSQVNVLFEKSYKLVFFTICLAFCLKGSGFVSIGRMNTPPRSPETP